MRAATLVAVNNMRWVNQSQTQTLYMATILAYFRAVFTLLWLSSTATWRYRLLLTDVLDNVGLGQLGWDLAPVILMFALAGGALGIANEKKWGYYVCSGAAIYAAVAVLWWMQRTGDWFELGNLIRLMFDGALVVLLFHPMSREYRKIWFR